MATAQWVRRRRWFRRVALGLCLASSGVVTGAAAAWSAPALPAAGPGSGEAEAPEAASPAGQASPNVGEVVLAGIVILRISQPLPGLTPMARASLISQRLLDILAARRAALDQLPEEVRVRLVGGEVAIFVGSDLVATVDQAHADYHRSTRLALAGVWADRLRQALREFARLHAGPAVPELEG